MTFLLSLLAMAQVGPFVTPRPQSSSPLPPEVVERKQRDQQRRRQEAPTREAPPPPQAPAERSQLDECLAAVNADPGQAVDLAQAWLQTAKGAAASQAGHCLGVALGRLERWDEAESAFLAARESAGDQKSRARLGAMAGNAALARNAPGAALVSLDAAHADALAGGDKQLAGDVAIDRARALVALKRDDDAASALAEARAALPSNAQAWLLSATLSRRMNKLADAQAQIQKAAELMPIDPEIGLEAGVIAVLSGRDEAARKSWQSVIDAAPKSEAAATARGYLAQLGGSAPAKP